MGARPHRTREALMRGPSLHQADGARERFRQEMSSVATLRAAVFRVAGRALGRLTAQSPLRVWLAPGACGTWRARQCSHQPVACGARRGGEDVGSRMGWLWASRASGRCPPPAWRSDAGSGAVARSGVRPSARGFAAASQPGAVPSFASYKVLSKCYSVGKSGSRKRPCHQAHFGRFGVLACRAKNR